MIIGISGKKGHGKDTVAKMIQYFTSSGMLNVPNWKYLGKPTEWVDIMMKDRPEYFTLDGKWQNKKFAGKLKHPKEGIEAIRKLWQEFVAANPELKP